MPTSNYTRSDKQSASIKDFGWHIQSLVQNFLQTDRASIARNLKTEGFRTSQIARVIYGVADKNSMNKVDYLLKESK